jgi:hypothetical protein
MPSADPAHRARRMKAEIIMPRAQGGADAARGFVTGDKRRDHVAPAALALFGEREQCRQDRHRRMSGHCEIDVVVIEGMSRRAVHQSCRQGWQADRMADDAGLRVARRLGQFVEQDHDERIVGARQRAAVIIEHALPRPYPHRLGQRVI